MKFFTLLFTLFTAIFYAQDLASFNAIYTKTFLETSQKDFNKALRVADSLYTISETPLLQAKSLMLTATLYQQTAEFEKALLYALKSEKIIEKTDNAIWKARVYGFLASQYRFVRLYDKSKAYSEMGFAISKEITNQEVANNTMAMMMQEMAYYDIEKKEYKNSIQKLKKSEEYLEKTTANKLVQTIDNEQLLGYNYYHIGDFEESFNHYEKALELSKDIPENYRTALIHNGFTLLYLQKNDLKNAKKHLDITLRITEQSKNPSLKNEVYETSEKYYAATKNLEGYVKTREKHDTVKKTLQKNVQFLVNKSYSKIDKENTQIKKSDSSKSIIIVIITALFVAGLLLFLRYRRIQKLNIQHFKKIIRDLDEKPEISFTKDNTDDRKDTLKTVTQPMMPPETEEKILSFLQKFEESEMYTDNNISLSYLATYCETNGKYLSYIINTYKNNDFNNYINILRIHYVIQKLRNNPTYRKYKIATLAEEAGFSSLNKFSTVFKKATTLTPSLFIKYLNEDKLKDREITELLEIKTADKNLV